MTAPIGTASVAILSDTTGFKRDLDAKLAKINPTVRVKLAVNNRELGRLRTRIQTVSPVIRVKAEWDKASLRELKASISGAAGIQSAPKVQVMLTLAQGARVKFQRELDNIRPPLTVKVNPILGDLNRRGLGGISQTIRADVDKKSFGDSLIYITRLGDALAKLAIPAAIAGAIPTILGLAAAAAQAAQSAALLPAVLGAGAFAFGAIKIGAMGFGEALKNIGDPEKFAESIASLSPAARDAALAFQGLRGPFLEMKTIVQDGLFADLAPQITALGNTYLPILTERFERITIAANSAGLDIARMLQTAEGIANVKSLGSAAAASFENLSGAVAPLAQAFLDVAQVGGTFLPGLTDGAQGAAQAFADMIRSAKESGGIATFIQEGLDALKQLGSIAGNVGSALGGVFSAGSISGGGFLTTLETITQSLADVINSTAGQNALGSFFEATSIVANTLGDTLKVIAPSLATILKAAEEGIAIIAPSIAPLAKAAGDMLAAMSPLIPVIAEVGKIVAEVLTEALVELMPTIRVVVDAFAKALAPVLPVIADALKELVRALSPVVAVIGGVLADALTMIMPVLGEVAEIIADALVMALNELKPYLPQIADAFRQLMEQLIPLLPMLVQMSTEFLTAMLPALVELIPSFLDLVLAITPLLPPLTELAVTLMPLLSTVLQTTVVPALKTLAVIIDSVVVPILEGLLIPVLETGIGVLTVLTDTLNFVLETFNSVFGAIQDVVINILEVTVLPLFQRVVDFLNFVFTGAVNTFGAVIDTIWRGIGTVIDTTIRGPIDSAFGFFKDAMQKVQDFAGGVKDGIAQVWDQLRDAMRKPINFFIEAVWNNGIVKAWNTMTGWIPGLGDKVKLGTLEPIKLATGGPVGGTGTGDTVPALLTPGEFVVRRQIAKPARRFLSALNAGQAEAWQAAGGRNAVGPTKFAAGGPVAAEHVARGAVGKPYVWGATGPNSFDCSGLWSAITNAALGAATYGNRRFTTSSFGGGGAGGLVPGRGALTVGVQTGHMGGTLAGTNYEATPPRVRGPGALGALNFPRQYFLPQIGGAFVGGSGGGGGGGVFDFIGKIMDTFNPVRALIDPGINALMPGEGPYKDLAKRLPHIVVDAVIDRAKELATDIFGLGTDLFTGAVGGIAGVFGDASVRQQVAMVAHRYRWGPPTQHWNATDKLIQGESGWNPNARNPNSSAAGLFQKMQSIHGPVESTPAGQAAWGFGYIRDRYGDPINAYSKWLSRSPHWYANGGIATKATLGVFGEAGAEAIIPLSHLAGLIKNIIKTVLGAAFRRPPGSASAGQPYLPAASLPGFQQIQRSDSPMRTAGSSLHDWQSRIDAERRRIESQVNNFKIELQNHGVLGSQREVQRWLQQSLQQLQREGKLPQGVRV